MFGRGIVPTTDDFGPMGQMPSNPQLLDWLAADFMENDWSVKRMIREIALSYTYRQSSKGNPANSSAKIDELDPDNTGLYRMPVRRITSEAIRDSLLAHSGRLDRKMFGPSVAVHRTAFMTGRGAGAAVRRTVREDGASTDRFTVISFLLSCSLLTNPPPSEPKAEGPFPTCSAQSLALLNDPFVVSQCNLWGKKIHQLNVTDEEKIRKMHEQAFGSLPEDEKIALFVAFMDRQSSLRGKMNEQVWGDLAHVFVNSKNFIYLK